MRKRVGLIGDPVVHSISPVFQQAAFDALALAARYEAWHTPAAVLAERIAGLRAPDILGANVTVPHKQAVLPLLDRLHPLAARTGAVNTIVNEGGRLVGYNTDITGFLEALRLDGGIDPQGTRAVVLGAGGAARAVVLALLDAGASRVRVLNRTAARAAALVAELADGRGDSAALEPDQAARLLAGADLVVNCTTVGMRHSAQERDLPVPADAIPAGTMVVDIVANPPVTAFLAAAAERGCRTLGGLPMLVRQGAAAFALWTGLQAPVSVMMDAAYRVMGVAG